MKTTVLSLFFLFIFLNSYSQYPTIDSITIAPDNPTNTDTIEVTIYGTVPHTACLTGPGMVIDSFSFPQLYIKIGLNCSGPGDLITTSYSYMDSIGILSVNNYYLHCQLCIYINSQTFCDNADTSFTIIPMNINTNFKTDYNNLIIHPNPFNNSTQIIFSIQETTNVRLYITNIYGTEILELVNNELSKGIHNITIKSSALASGIYYCILETKDRRSHIKLVKL